MSKTSSGTKGEGRIGGRFLVSGRVQGVGFRAFVLSRARKLGLVGTVANLADGRVEVEAVGEPEALDKLESRLRKGPGGARVRDVERQEIAGDAALGRLRRRLQVAGSNRFF